MSFTRFACLAIFASLLGACGGGGGGSSAPAVVQQVNRAPTSVSLSSSSVLEGSKGVSIGTLNTSDPDGGSFNYTISGDDASSFRVSGSTLQLAAGTAADYETKTSYSITIESTDSGNLSISKDFTISVIDAIEGRVVDAPLSGSNVFIDLNGNSIQDADEPSGTSDANGFFVVENLVVEGSPKIISIGGTDTKTGKVLPNLALMSDLPSDPSKAMAVTPITTVVAAAETPEAKAKVLEVLGVTGTVEELLTTDNWAAAEAGDEAAKEVQRKNQQIGLILQTAETLVESEGATKATDITQAVAKQLVEVASSSATIDLTQTATITAVLTDAVAQVAPTVTIAAETIAAVSSSVSDVNTLVADSTLDPTGDASKEILEAAQTTLQTSVEELAAGTVDVAAFETATESKNLFEGSAVLEALPDFDEDGLADAVDLDDDNDGVLDSLDVFPKDANETVDTDSDGIGNNADTDDDGDTVLDTADAFPLDSTESADSDGDGVGDNADVFPQDKNESKDFDKDGVGDNADTDDDNDGTLDTVDDKPFDAFPLDDTISVAQVIDSGKLPEALVVMTELTIEDPNISETESGGMLMLLSGSVSKSINQNHAKNLIGTWSVKDNQVQVKDLTDGASSFPYVGGSIPSDWTNVNTTYWNANIPDPQIETTSKTDQSHWLLESASGRWVFYVKTTVKTFIKDSNYVVDASLPVNETTTYAKTTYYDSSRAIAFTSSEVIGTWAFEMDFDVANTEPYYGGKYLHPDLAVFYEDGTGITVTTRRRFSWSLTDAGRLVLVYTDNSMRIELTKYAEYADSVAVHSFGSTGTGDLKLVSDYSLGVKDAGQSIDLTLFYGKGLAASTSDKYAVPKDTTAESYSSTYFGYEFNADGTIDNYLQYFGASTTGSYWPSGGTTVGDNDVYKLNKGWGIRTYTYTMDGNKVVAKACRTVSSCSVKWYRDIYLLRASTNRLYYLLKGYKDEDAGDTDKAVADLKFLTSYMGFLEVFDYHDIDGDGKENKDDAYPYDPLAQ